jgi:hypothetical protein
MFTDISTARFSETSINITKVYHMLEEIHLHSHRYQIEQTNQIIIVVDLARKLFAFVISHYRH